MMSVKDWVFSQVISKSIGSTRPLSASESFLSQESPNEDLGNRGLTPTNSASTSTSTSRPMSTQNNSSSDIQTTQNPLLTPPVENSSVSTNIITEERDDSEPLSKVESLQIILFRLLQRLNMWEDNNLTVAKVLYRIHLASLIRAGEESDLKRANLKSNRAQAIAMEQEESGSPELNFSLRILLLGKTGVGKSSTINSILGGQSKATTNAFQPSTHQIQEIKGNLNGVKICFIDTPGLLPLSEKSNAKNRKILHSVRRFIRKSPPDIVLYFERLDLIHIGYSDFPLFKLIAEILGPTIWFSTNIVMTHSAAALPEGQNGYPVSYDSYVSYCTKIMQHHIQQAVFDTKIENPVILVENHPDNISRKKAWVSQFMLLCICTKILGDVNNLLCFGDTIKLGPPGNSRVPSLPHLLSSFLKHRVRLDETDERQILSNLENEEDEHEYDQLPPIRILTKAQFQKLTPSQRKDYLDELDYRETLYLKKQLRQEYHAKNEKNNEQEEEPPEPTLLPDMSIPLSFDSDNPTHRFRCLVTGDSWIARPVVDPNGYDHDVGFDGINLEVSSEIRKNLVTFFTGQMSKDKQELNVQCESTVGFLGSNGGPTYSTSLDVQSAGREVICSARGNVKVKSFERNLTECGVCLISVLNQYYYGVKVEDVFMSRKRVDFKVSGGGMGGGGKVVCGGGLEVSLRGRDYPVRDEKVSLGVSVVSYEKEVVLGGVVESEFRVGIGKKVCVSGNLNSRRMGGVRVKVTSLEHVEVAFVALISVFGGLLRKKLSGGDRGSEC